MFTKSDLRDEDIITYRNGKQRTVHGKELIDSDGNSCTYIDTMYSDDLTCRSNRKYDIVKVERPIKYETVYERKEEILDEAEKRYLRDVIRPFKNKVKGIVKILNTGRGKEYITIEIKNDAGIQFPYFRQNTKYKHMELEKYYTLEELRTIKE